MFEFMKAQFACAVTLRITIKDNRQQGGSNYQQWHYYVGVFAQGVFYESLHQRSAGLTVGKGMWRVMKGYIHDRHHTPARLNAETIRLQISIWNRKTVAHQSAYDKWQKGWGGCHSGGRALLKWHQRSIACQSVQLLVVIQQRTTSASLHLASASLWRTHRESNQWLVSTTQQWTVGFVLLSQNYTVD